MRRGIHERHLGPGQRRAQEGGEGGPHRDLLLLPEVSWRHGAPCAPPLSISPVASKGVCTRGHLFTSPMPHGRRVRQAGREGERAEMHTWPPPVGGAQAPGSRLHVRALQDTLQIQQFSFRAPLARSVSCPLPQAQGRLDAIRSRHQVRDISCIRSNTRASCSTQMKPP